MSKLKSIIAVAVIVSFFSNANARAGELTVLSATLGSSVGTGVLTYLLVVKLNAVEARQKDLEEAEKSAQLYLEENSVQLTRDLQLGHGPLVNDLAVAMNIKPQNMPAFAKMLRANRQELAELSRKESLTPKRAGDFVRLLGDRALEVPELRSDLETLRV